MVTTADKSALSLPIEHQLRVLQYPGMQHTLLRLICSQMPVVELLSATVTLHMGEYVHHTQQTNFYIS